jgi:hypothetical protein
VPLAALILLSIGDGLLATLLIMLSGFTFGYHEGLHGAPSTVAIWSAGLAACVGAPVAGFVLRAHDKPAIGIIIAGLPIVVALYLGFVG